MFFYSWDVSASKTHHVCLKGTCCGLVVPMHLKLLFLIILDVFFLWVESMYSHLVAALDRYKFRFGIVFNVFFSLGW